MSQPLLWYKANTLTSLAGGGEEREERRTGFSRTLESLQGILQMSFKMRFSLYKKNFSITLGKPAI